MTSTENDTLKCPHCRKPLGGKEGLEGLEHDVRGFYVLCRHCRERVDLRDQSVHPGPRVWTVAP